VPAGSRTEQEVLDAARDCILAVGWRRTTLTEIARRAGVSRMTIYRLWPDTQGLLADLLTREWTALDAAVADRTGEPDPADPHLASVLAALIVSTVQALREDPLFKRIVEVDPELLLPYLLERRGRSQQMTLDRLTQAITAGVTAGTLRPVDPDHVARALLLTGHGFVLSAQTMTGRGISTDDLDRQLAEMVTGYLRP
jgi:AcrR family transcriptional regulator